MSEIDELRAEVSRLTAELAAARRNERLLQSLLDHLPDFIAHVTLDGHFIFLNRFAPGFTPQDLAEKTVFDFFDPTAHAVMRAAMQRVIATGHQFDYESIGAGANGRATPYYTRVAPVIANGVVESLVLLGTDVSRLKNAEQALAHSQTMLQHVLTSAKMGMWWWDLETVSGGRDDATAAMLGIPRGASQSPELEAFVHPDDRQLVRAAYATAVANGSFGPIEHRCVHQDGRVLWISSTGRLVDGPHGKRLIGGLRDITERKQLETSLAQSQKLESIGRLAGGIAHDFNNMLTVISSYTERALRGLSPDSTLYRDLESVKLAAERSTALTRQLLAFARKQPVMPTVTQIDDVVRRVHDLLQRVLGSEIEMSLHLGSNRHVRIDISQFEQVLLNLTTNARDAMPSGGRLVIETADVILGAAELASRPSAAPGAYVRLRVTDSGAGISAADLEHIFEPFFTTKDPGKGTGLGLATCYGIVAQSEGFMTVTSELGRGTTFEVFLPSTDG